MYVCMYVCMHVRYVHYVCSMCIYVCMHSPLLSSAIMHVRILVQLNDMYACMYVCMYMYVCIQMRKDENVMYVCMAIAHAF